MVKSVLNIENSNPQHTVAVSVTDIGESCFPGTLGTKGIKNMGIWMTSCRDWNLACCRKHARNHGIGHFNTHWELTWKIAYIATPVHKNGIETIQLGWMNTESCRIHPSVHHHHHHHLMTCI